MKILSSTAYKAENHIRHPVEEL